jgi:N-acetylmuramoyl-L-alanine amidase
MEFVIIHNYKNYGGRAGTTIDTIVLHATASSSVQSAIAWFTNPESKVSAHYVIDKRGTVYRLVPQQYAAWHAGACYMKRANLRSIGIELVNKNDGIEPYTPEQLTTMRQLILLLKNNLPIRYLVSHAEIAKPQGRKTDPIGIDMNRLREVVGLQPYRIEESQ